MATSASPHARFVRPANQKRQPPGCTCRGTTVGRDGRSRLLAPIKDPLPEGEVHEDMELVKHVASLEQPTADQVERHRVDHTPFGHGSNVVSWGEA